MTKLPLESRAVTGVYGPNYETNMMCAAPGCDQLGTERHHIFRRSFLAGDYIWIELPDGRHLGNLVKLCNFHHRQITVNAAWLNFEDDVFLWTDLISAAQPLSWQPPFGTLEAVPSDKPVVIPDPAKENPERTPDQIAADGVCPKCLRPLPHPKNEHEEKRVRRSWTITVPLDERENGAETLDTLLEAARQEMAKAGLPYGDEAAVRFFVLSGALGLFILHAGEVLG